MSRTGRIVGIVVALAISGGFGLMFLMPVFWAGTGSIGQVMFGPVFGAILGFGGVWCYWRLGAGRWGLWLSSAVQSGTVTPP